MIKVTELSKNYGRISAIANVCFTIEKGEVVGFLGPNGAGKSTTMNIITGYVSPSEGRVVIGGYSVADNPTEAKTKVGYLPETPPLYGELTVNEYLKFVSRIKGIGKNEQKAQISETCDLVGINAVKSRLIRNLSRGYKQRVGMAQALIGNPPVLVLDEPTIGLDPQQMSEIRNVIKLLSKDRTILLSSHILSEVSAVCNRVLIINKGRIVGEGTPQELSRRISNSGSLQLRICGEADDVLKSIRAVEGVSSIKQIPSQENDTVDLIVESQKNLDLRDQLFSAICDGGFTIRMMAPVRSSLEEVFLQLTADIPGDEE
ncbi:MAG: ABC transporter ATP-binding protein [Spirochaetales bacterium]|jgi:ABC-2 type transport system ATP-binding protein|nr:ABC transporter ATP-binding protein [Spirochaetales bacterium]